MKSFLTNDEQLFEKKVLLCAGWLRVNPGTEFFQTARTIIRHARVRLQNVVLL